MEGAWRRRRRRICLPSKVIVEVGEDYFTAFSLSGALGDLSFSPRSPMLYPAELRAHESFQGVSNRVKLFGSFLALVVAATFRP